MNDTAGEAEVLTRREGRALFITLNRPAALNALNERISEAISASGEAHLPTTRVHGRTSLRVCFLHYDNDENDVEHLVQLVSRLAPSLASQPGRA